MKKLFIILSIVLVSLLLLNFFVGAHSGKTDSNGGHYDHSTGEYHYHHGYPAHSHYDMNGDGIKDCPYKFDDKTNSGSSTSKNGSDFGIVAIAIIVLIPIALVSAWLWYMLWGMIMIIIQEISDKFFDKKIDDNQREKITKILLAVSLVIEIPLVFIYFLTL